MGFSSILPRRLWMLLYGVVSKLFLGDPFLSLHFGVTRGGGMILSSKIKDLRCWIFSSTYVHFMRIFRYPPL